MEQPIRADGVAIAVCTSVQPVLALLGHPVGGNPAQFMFEKAFSHHQLDWRYLSLEVAPDDLNDAIRGMRAMGFRGGNLTDPHKDHAAGLLDRLGPAAEWTGVVNCIVRDDQGLVGENTEGLAVLESLRKRLDPAGRRAVVLGAGRMARGIAVELARANVAEIVVVSRREDAGQSVVELAGRLGSQASCVPWKDPYSLPPEVHVLVDATSAGREDSLAPCRLSLEGLSPETVVADVRFNPPRTWLLHEAAQRGCPTIDGLEIYVEQAAAAFRLWTGVDPDRTILRDAVE
ncbi:MAG: shikimate dehydrogenase, partial [Thermoguttaceae bacterium]|nr:shikimate dehydrogenase [Thermoguttaceae bacterium]